MNIAGFVVIGGILWIASKLFKHGSDLQQFGNTFSVYVVDMGGLKISIQQGIQFWIIPGIKNETAATINIGHPTIKSFITVNGVENELSTTVPGEGTILIAARTNTPLHRIDVQIPLLSLGQNAFNIVKAYLLKKATGQRVSAILKAQISVPIPSLGQTITTKKEVAV